MFVRRRTMWSFRRSRSGQRADQSTARAAGAPAEGGKDPRLSTLWIVVSGLLLATGILAGTVYMVDDFGERALASSTRELVNTVLLVTRHFDQEFADVLESQSRLAVKLRIDDMTSPEDFRERMAGPEIHALLSTEVRHSVHTDELFLFDVDGKLVNTSEDGPPPSFDA